MSVREWHAERNGIAYSVPCQNNGDPSRSRVAWIVTRWRKEATAYQLFCLVHEGFMCDCIDKVVAHRRSMGITDVRPRDDDDGA